MAEDKKSGDSQNSDKQQSDNSQNSGNSKDEQKGQQITIYEWVVAALGAILVFGSIIFMTYKAVTANDEPPDLTVKLMSVEKVNAGYLVKFEVKNEGEYTAAAAAIKGELKQGEKAEETSTTTVAYVPSYSTRSGGMFFTKNPEDYKLDLRATGYTEP